jgi:hypothetical protein
MEGRRCAYLALLLLSLCACARARASGNAVHVGDGLYSGGSLEFKIKRVSPFFFSFFFPLYSVARWRGTPPSHAHCATSAGQNGAAQTASMRLRNRPASRHRFAALADVVRCRARIVCCPAQL